MIYTYTGPEISLGIPVVTLKEMHVESCGFDKEAKEFYAHGDLSFYDYSEGCRGMVNWEATKAFPHATMWVIRPAGESYFTDRNGDPVFTLITETNSAMEEFISLKLDMILERMGHGEPVADLVESETLSDKPRMQYTGACVCDEILKSSVTSPFRWQELTRGGQYPDHCFACSCGAHWWEYDHDKHLWAPVPDDELWEHLLQRDGIPTTPICGLQDGFYSAKQMRQMGLIPIG